jgi:hypothetical protein
VTGVVSELLGTGVVGFALVGVAVGVVMVGVGVGVGVGVDSVGVGVGESDGVGVSLGVAETSEALGVVSARATPVSIVRATVAAAARSSGRRRWAGMTLILVVSASGCPFPSVISVTSG